MKCLQKNVFSNRSGAATYRVVNLKVAIALCFKRILWRYSPLYPPIIDRTNQAAVENTNIVC